jgi:putative mRNA 3-end processing factor
VTDRTLGLELQGGDLCLRALGLTLDPAGSAPAAFISHAHVPGKALESGRVLASPETLAILASLGAGAGAGHGEPIGWADAVELPVDPAFGGGTARLSIAPAGHALGAAQLVVDHAAGRLVYTGDWSGGTDATHATGVVVPCDELVTTSTFALPIFRFEPGARTLSALVEWCATKLEDGVIPLVLAQSPGPAQSIARALAERGLAVAGDDDMRRVCAAYEALGVAIGPVRAHEPRQRGAVVLAAPGARANQLRGRGRVEVAYASGWALLDAAVEQKRADAAFVYADHADHDELVALVRGSGARRVRTTRGDARTFAHLLRGMGIEAEAIELPPIDERGAS